MFVKDDKLIGKPLGNRSLKCIDYLYDEDEKEVADEKKIAIGRIYIQLDRNHVILGKKIDIGTLIETEREIVIFNVVTCNVINSVTLSYGTYSIGCSNNYLVLLDTTKKTLLIYKIDQNTVKTFFI